jgi:hypothetical protein
MQVHPLRAVFAPAQVREDLLLPNRARQGLLLLASLPRHGAEAELSPSGADLPSGAVAGTNRGALPDEFCAENVSSHRNLPRLLLPLSLNEPNLQASVLAKTEIPGRSILMKNTIANLAAIVGMVGIGLSLTMPAKAASADSNRLERLSAQWWEWAISIPASHNPMLDATGVDCVVGQRGPVWFLAGTFSGGPATRTCSLPEGKALFLPVVNYVSINSPNVCGQGPGNLSAKDLRGMAAAYIDGITSVSVQLDGQAIDARRVQSVVFAVPMPADNIFVQPCNGDSPAGVYSPGVDDGFYVALDPLRPGKHTLHFQAQYRGGTVQDTTYNLILVPVLRK